MKASAVTLPLIAAFLFATPAVATPVNGDFSSGLAAWTSIGDVTADDGGARLSDEGANYSVLYQGDPLAGGPTTLSFDFRAELSSAVPGGPFGFPDTFFTTLYLTDDLGAFDLSPGSFGDAASLFDYDYSGAASATGSIGASSTRPGWLTYTREFDSTFAYAIPVFELVDQNFIGGDSVVWIDNVVIEPSRTGGSAIPEPSAALLFGFGAIAIANRIRNAAKQSAR